jgi:hypothetical protein
MNPDLVFKFATELYDELQRDGHADMLAVAIAVFGADSAPVVERFKELCKSRGYDPRRVSLQDLVSGFPDLWALGEQFLFGGSLS